MASSKVCRLSSKIHSLTQRLSKTNVHVSSIPSPIKSSLPSSATPRINRSFRVPVELSSCVSMFPLHSAIASSRLVSSLSAESMSWGLVPQGHSSLSLYIPTTAFKNLVYYYHLVSSVLKNEALLHLYLISRRFTFSCFLMLRMHL
ncbi:unnamed protein product [Brassica rapa]|uniref:Uncharacterized protein n=2 Tax=Brassica TaxID=3705 RepID=A0A3P5YBF6_BRACM|nr:unnamed protein product [Brassica napus]CAG7867794.1 unnamed protein product [Brassica rapa]CDY24049.1 BnaA06g00470D [Brassica napus]VDC64709.1 unnamed protein product [Brassica rapa]